MLRADILPPDAGVPLHVAREDAVAVQTRCPGHVIVHGRARLRFVNGNLDAAGAEGHVRLARAEEKAEGGLRRKGWER